MTASVFHFPRYAKLAFILFSLSIILLILYLAQNIIIPLILALLFAILLRPLVVFLTNRLKFPHIVAAMVSVTLFVIVVVTILFFISWQVSDMTNDWNKIKYNLSVHVEHFEHWVKQRYHISYFKQENYIHKITQETLNGDSNLMGSTLNSFTDTLLILILIPIYTFLILLYRTLFIKFLYKVVSSKNETMLQDVLTQVKTVVQSYIIGILIEMGIVCALTTSGFMILGLQYAILLGLITAILNLIPYVGILVATVISIFATLVNSNEISLIIGIIVLNGVVHLLDNNIIIPKIVGTKVRINALATMVAVIIGGTLVGIPGMILSIPLIAIIKVIFDHIEPLKPWGFLMGSIIPETKKLVIVKRK